jgi:uncharacterized repeat protein (TIGR04138 family)
MKVTVEEVAEKAKCTTLAAELVIKGLQFATGVKGLEGAASTQVSAQELCGAVAETAKAYYGPSLPAILTKAGILRSEDLGRIVFSLIDQGLLRKREDETIADFEGLFETARLI